MNEQQINEENLRKTDYCHFLQLFKLFILYFRYEIVNIDLKEKPEWYDQVSALGKVPLLEEPGNRRIVESLIIAEYVDQVHRNKPLLSDDPLARAKQKMLVEVIGTKVGTKFVLNQLFLERKEITILTKSDL